MEIQIDGRVAQLQLVDKDGNRVRIAVDDRVYDVDIVIADNGVCSLICDGRSFNMEAVRLGNGKRYRINRGFNQYNVEIVDAQEKYMRLRRRDEDLLDDTLVAPMPGKIVKIDVAPGDAVATGDVLVVFEAMKMQSNLKAGGDCTVAEVLVAAGDSVAAGQPLVKLNINTDK